jgi:predicted metal-binding membrane protein
VIGATQIGRPPRQPGVVELGLVASLLLVAAGGWVLTGDRMAGMDAGPGTALGGLGWFTVVWVTMMAAMMLPSLAPVVVSRARVQAGGRDRGATTPTGATTLFVAGYLITWAAAGLLAYAIVESIRSLGLGFLAWDDAGPYVAGGVILAAAGYQLTRLKSTALDHCRNPIAWLEQHWRPGRTGAVRMGIEHGRSCVGSSGGLMAALFALGVMSLGWMALVAALIAAEKLLPSKTIAIRGIVVVLVALGIAVAVAPGDLPGLTIPGGSSMAGQSMEMAP